MKKKQRIRKEGNIIHFPDVEQRLFEKGMELMEKKRFREAVVFLEEAHQLNPDLDEAKYVLMLAYYELAEWRKARELAEKMMGSGIGDYYQIVDFYLAILVELQDYEQLQLTVEALLDERDVPLEKLEHFRQMLDFSNRMLEQNFSRIEETDFDEEEEEVQVSEVTIMSPDEDPNELIRKAAQLAYQNIYPLMAQLDEILRAREVHPIVKTFVLNALKEHGVAVRVLIRKFNREIEVIPVELPDIRELVDEIEIKQLLTNQLEHDNPVLLGSLCELLGRHSLCLYPFEREPKATARAYAAAYHLLGLQYFGQASKEEELYHLYQTNQLEVEKVYPVLLQLEEISCMLI